MSVFAYTGLPGSGKTYSVVKHQILPGLKSGRLVVTNVPVKRDLICSELGVGENMLREFPTELVASNPESIFEHFPEGALLVLDEVWKLFPAGLKTNQVPEAFKTAFAEHRHRVDKAGRAAQIVLVTQDLNQVAVFARSIVEQTFRTSKLWQIGMSGRYRVDVFPFPVTGPNPNVAQALRQIFGKYEKSVFRFYTSHTQSLAEADGADESAVDKRGNVLLKPTVLLMPVAIIALVWFGWTHLHRPLSSGVKAPAGGTAAGGAVGGPAAGGLFAGIGGAGSGTAGVDGARARPAGQIQVLGSLQGGVGSFRDAALLTDGEHEWWVDLKACKRLRFGWECAASMAAAAAAVHGPVGAYSSAPPVKTAPLGRGVVAAGQPGTRPRAGAGG